MKHSQNDISIVLRCSVRDSIIAVAQIWPTPDAFIRPSAWVDGTWAVRSWSEPPNRFTVGWHVTMLQPACVLTSFKQEQTVELISFHTVYWQGEGVWCVLVIWNCECVRIIIMVCFVFFSLWKYSHWPGCHYVNILSNSFQTDCRCCCQFMHIIATAENIKSPFNVLLCHYPVVITHWQMHTYNAFQNVHIHCAK